MGTTIINGGRKMSSKGNVVVSVLLAVGAVSILPLIVWFLSLWTDRNLEFWFEYLKGTPVDVPMWMSVIVTIVLNGVIVAANILTELFKLAV
jgi:hypothetical protein